MVENRNAKTNRVIVKNHTKYKQKYEWEKKGEEE